MFSIAHSLSTIKGKLTLLYRDKKKWVPVAVFVGAAAIRMWSINQSLWLDEGITTRVARTYSFIEIVSVFAPDDFHPPLFYLIVKAWAHIWGTSVVALRMLSVTTSILAGIFIYLLVKKYHRSQDALVATSLYLFNPLIVYYAQEVRMYSMITLWVSGILYYTYPFITEQEPRMDNKIWSIIYANVFIFLAILTFYGSLLFVAGICLVLVIRNRYVVLWRIMPGIMIALAVIMPLLYQQLMHAHVALDTISGWSHVLGHATLHNLLLIPIKFTSGRISFDPKMLYYTFAGIWTVLIWWGVVKGGYKRKMLGFLCMAPLVLGFFLSFFTPLMQYFRFLYLLPIVAILITYGYQSLKMRLLIVAGYILWSCVYLGFSNFHREDWKSLAQNLPTTTIYAIPQSMDALRYYQPYIEIRDIRTLNPTRTAENIYVIPYTFPIYGVDHYHILTQYGFTQINIQSHRGVHIETWSQKRIISQQHATPLQ